MVKVARSAGFCFGVRNAIEVVEDLLKKGERVCTLGNIIHSPQVVEMLKKKGVRVVKRVSEVEDFEVLVIRSHGVGLKVYEEINKNGLRFKDATCPFVKKTQIKVLNSSKKWRNILIAGDFSHPEVIGIEGFCKSRACVFSSLEDLKRMFLENKNLKEEGFLVVAQTTFNVEVWQNCVDFIKFFCSNFEIFSSICPATTKRQKEADECSKDCDFAFVVGGKNSSNTRKLYDICRKNCRSFFVESVLDLKEIGYEFRGRRIFLTAGASTPDFLIAEIIDKINSKIL